MVRMLVLAEYDYERSAWRDYSKIGMWNHITVATCHADFVRTERNRVIEFANGWNDHRETYSHILLIVQDSFGLTIGRSEHLQ